MKRIILLVVNVIFISCVLSGAENPGSSTPKEKKKKSIPHINLRLSSPKPQSPKSSPKSSRKNSVDAECSTPKINTPDSLRLALAQTRGELQKSRENSPGRNVRENS